MAQDIIIGGRLHSAATGNTVAGANEILDDAKGKKQNVINQEVNNEIGSDSADGTIKGRIKSLETAVGSGGSVDERISETKAEIIGDAAADYNTLGKVEDKIQAEVSRSEGAEEALDAAKANKATTLEGYGITDAYTKSETYTKTEVNGLVDTPHQNYVTVLTYAALIAIDPGSTDTIYRVSNYDGSVPQVDVTKYSEYAWDGTQYVFLCVKSQIDEVFDISVYNNNATYADLAAALGTNGANVPQTLRRGGMSVKYVQSSDNKYVQYFLTKNTWSASEGDWEKMNLEEEISQLGRFIPDDGFFFYKDWKFDLENPNSGYLVELNSPIIVEAGSRFIIHIKLNTFSSQSGTTGAISFFFRDENDTYYDKLVFASGEYVEEFVATQNLKINGYGFNCNNMRGFSGNCIYSANMPVDYSKFKEATETEIATIKQYIDKTIKPEILNFFINATSGYLNPSGDVGEGVGIVTDYLPVSQGETYHYKGKWMQNDAIKMVWGYDSNKSNPVALVPSAEEIIDIDFQIPSGVSYIRAWSESNPTISPELIKGDSLKEDVVVLKEQVQELDLVTDILNDRESLLTSVVNTKSLAKNGSTDAFSGYVVNNVPFLGEGKIKKLYVYSPTANSNCKVFVCYPTSASSETATFKTKSVYSLELVAGFNEIDVNIDFSKGDYLGMYCNVVSDLPAFFNSQTNGWWWNSSSSIPAPEVDSLQGTEYLPNYSLAYGVYACYINPKEDVTITTIVVERNQADYNSIREIINGITDASEKHRYIVYVPNGEYFECDLQGKDYVEIVGQDMDKTIIYCDGTSSNLTPDGYAYGQEYSNVPLNSLSRQYKHVFFVTQNCKVKNLTIKANDCKYCVHLDSSTYETAIFENCVFLDVANNNHPVGIGMHSGQVIELKNCVFRCLQNQRIGFFAHNWNNQSKPTKLVVEGCLFDNCSFADIDELGSEQNDEWYIRNCFSSVGGEINFTVDINSNGTTYWTNPQTGEKEPDPRLVPYCIKLNCLGSNVLSCLQSYFYGSQVQAMSRPDFAKYLITDHYIRIPKGEYSVGTVIRRIMRGDSLSSNDNSILGVVEYIIGDYAYVARTTTWISGSIITGSAPTLGSAIYEDSNSIITTDITDKKIGTVINYSSGLGYWQLQIFSENK